MVNLEREDGGLFHPPLFPLMDNVLRPTPVFPLVIHAREIGTRIFRIIIVIHGINRFMRATGLINGMLIFPVYRLHASINAHMTFFVESFVSCWKISMPTLRALYPPRDAIVPFSYK